MKRIFPEYWPAGPGTHRTLLQYPYGPSLNFDWLSRGVLLLGAPATNLLGPSTIRGSIKRIFPEYWTSAGQRGNNTHNKHYGPYLNFEFELGDPGVRTKFNHMATQLVLYPGFRNKTNFPRILTRQAPYPQDPSTSDLCFSRKRIFPK